MLSKIMPMWVIQTLDSAHSFKKLTLLLLRPPAGHADGTPRKGVRLSLTPIFKTSYESSLLHQFVASGCFKLVPTSTRP